MFEYNTPEVSALSDVARRQYVDGAPFITLGSVRVHRDAVIVTPNGDTLHAVRALLVAMDALTVDDVTRELEDATAFGFDVHDAIADVYADAVTATEFEEYEDGSVAVVPVPVTVRRGTDTSAVTVRHADGTVTVERQTVTDALAVIVEGQKRALALVESGELADYADDVDADLI